MDWLISLLNLFGITPDKYPFLVLGLLIIVEAGYTRFSIGRTMGAAESPGRRRGPPSLPAGRRTSTQPGRAQMDAGESDSRNLELKFASLGVEAHDHLKTTHYAPPVKRGKGVMVKDAAELVAALKQKGLL